MIWLSRTRTKVMASMQSDLSLSSSLRQFFADLFLPLTSTRDAMTTCDSLTGANGAVGVRRLESPRRAAPLKDRTKASHRTLAFF